MRREIKRHQKYKVLQITLDNHMQAFEGNQQALAILNSFNEKNNQLAELLPKVTRPVSTLYRPKMNNQAAFVKMLRNVIGMAIAVAAHTEMKISCIPGSCIGSNPIRPLRICSIQWQLICRKSWQPKPKYFTV